VDVLFVDKNVENRASILTPQFNILDTSQSPFRFAEKYAWKKIKKVLFGWKKSEICRIFRKKIPPSASNLCKCPSLVDLLWDLWIGSVPSFRPSV